MLPQLQNYSENALKRLLWQYRDSENLKALVEGLVEQLGITQQDAYDYANLFNIDYAYGSILDYVGKLVGVRRQGETDDEFRDKILLQIIFNNSEGTPNKILEGLALATNATKVELWEHFPAGIVLYSDGDRIPKNLVSAIRNSAPATVNINFIALDENQNSFVPSEFEIVQQILVNQNLDTFVNQDGDELEANNINTFANEGIDIERTYLSEYTYGEGTGTERNTQDGFGILAEVLI